MNTCKIIKNLLSRKECEQIASEFEKLNSKYVTARGVIGNCQEHYNFEYITVMQKILTPIISKEFDKNLGITYCFIRKYFRDSTLQSHRDRPSCEYSLTLNIKSSDPTAPWPLWFSIDGNKQNVILNQGDCCLYKGLEIAHGRDKCPVDWYIQVFMHWVDLNGKYKSYVDDAVVKELLKKNV